ncbi:GIY-YIG nuclease family protein [uncultured Victivallis sp.]|uniref:GIY-YIG nuclease family protein n=1 Tax=uncultured Victivallis sp. TaxID=354118 RepID=UPI002594F7CA|nr:GIY-YIG nuclease family protein [uncultured Victivallis sp.]
MSENLKIKTIKIELLEGIPEGVRRAEFTTQLMRVLVVPRDKQDFLEKLPEAKFQAVYLIVGEDAHGEPKVYIGKTRRMALRIKEHNKSGQHDFWQNVLYFVTKDNSLNSTEIEYLEWLLIRKATEAGNYKIDNNNKGCKEEPQVEPAKRADFADYYNQIVTLSAVLGHGALFNKMQLETPIAEIIYHCNARGSDAKMAIRDGEYYVLAGSISPVGMTDSGARAAFIGPTRKKLKNTGLLKEQNGKLVFLQDYKFTTPSGAAGVVVGNPMNGWTTWKDASGKTLDECIRIKEDSSQSSDRKN